jgi:hypothetical protein
MLYFTAVIVCQYDGLEWMDKVLIASPSEVDARLSLEDQDFTHNNGIEEQKICNIQEVPFSDYVILQKYLFEIED